MLQSVNILFLVLYYWFSKKYISCMYQNCSVKLTKWVIHTKTRKRVHTLYCNRGQQRLVVWQPTKSLTYHIISYHLFSFRWSVQDYKIHMDMKIVKFA